MKVLILAFLLSHLSLAQEILHVSTGEFPPYTGVKLHKGGYVLHMIKEAYAAVGIDVKFHFMPWSRAYKDGGSGKYDLSAFFVCTPERKELFHCSNSPVSKDDFVFFHNNKFKTPLWNKLEDLNNLNVGLTLGYFYMDRFKKLVKNYPQNNLSLAPVKSDLQNFRILVSGRIDVFPCDKMVGQYILRNQLSSKDAGTISFDKKTIFNQSTHVLFPKKNKRSLKLRERFEEGMSIILKNGIKDKIISDSLKGVYD